MSPPAGLIAAGEAQAFLTIDLGALVANWRLLAARVAPATCAAVLKADAYGTGIEAAGKALAAAGASEFFVAQLSEGRRLRAALPDRATAKIYILNAFIAKTALIYEANALTPVLGSAAELEAWRAEAPAEYPVVLHFDTGMNRLGFSASDSARLIAEGAFDRLRVVLVMSHFVASDQPDRPLNRRQIVAFTGIRQRFPGIRASLANSSGLFLPGKPYFDLVRPGYALYGGNPTPGAPNPMQPVVSLSAPILALRDIEAGETVGYDALWTAKRKTRLAVIGVGYADGLRRDLMATDTRPGGEAIVGGVRCHFAGRVSMDLTTIDVTDVPSPQLFPGAPVELLGKTISIDSMGASAGTIGYEVLTSLGRRYHRSYIGA